MIVKVQPPPRLIMTSNRLTQRPTFSTDAWERSDREQRNHRRNAAKRGNCVNCGDDFQGSGSFCGDHCLKEHKRR